MTSPNELPSTPPDAPAEVPARKPTALQWGALAAVATVCGVLGWVGGGAGLIGAVGAGLAVPLVLRHERKGTHGLAPTAQPESDEPRVSGGRVGAEVMVSQVVPVWGKQLEVTRSAASEELGKLLETFSQMSGSLETLSQSLEGFKPSVESGAVDAAMSDHSEALNALLSPSQRAFEQRDAAVAELAHCAQSLNDLRQLGRMAREIGKHTRLVAFNASIEAHRAGNGDEAGAQAVANETRMLAARMGEVGEQIDRLVSRLDKTLSEQRLHGEIDDTTPDELKLELQLRAREALGSLVGSLGAAMQGSGEMKAANAALRNQVDEIFVHFQFGDRLSQMLSIVGSDMDNFARWVQANPYASQSDAAEWLANLESSYTMEEQRSQHHGNVHIDRGSEIEFF